MRYTYNVDGLRTLIEVGTVANQSDGAWNAFSSTLQQASVYDGNRHKVQTSSAGGGMTYALSQTSYDALGRIDCVAQRMNPNAFGSLPAACTTGTSGSFGPDRIARNGYDPASELLSVTTAFGTANQRTETVTYTPNGKTSTATDAKGNLTAFAYDGVDRLAQTTFPSKTVAGQANSGDFESYGYDAAGNRTTFRKRDGRVFTFAYDGLNRVITKYVPTGCAPAPAGCPPLSALRTVYYGYDLRGLQTYARYDSASGEGITSTYDALGRRTASTTAMSGTSRTLSYLYDLAGGRTQVMHPDGVHFDTSYDAAEQMKNATWYAPSTGTVAFMAIQYDDLGRRIDINRASSNTGYFGTGLASASARPTSGSRAVAVLPKATATTRPTRSSSVPATMKITPIPARSRSTGPTRQTGSTSTRLRVRRASPTMPTAT